MSKKIKEDDNVTVALNRLVKKRPIVGGTIYLTYASIRLTWRIAKLACMIGGILYLNDRYSGATSPKNEKSASAQDNKKYTQVLTASDKKELCKIFSDSVFKNGMCYITKQTKKTK